MGDLDLHDIKIIFLDVDGVLTDGKIVLSENDECKMFDVKDGLGIKLAQRSGMKVGIVTARSSRSVERRSKELDLDYTFQGCNDKVEAISEVLEKTDLTYSNVCYVGDDIVDIPVLRIVGFSATVNDAVDPVKSMVQYVSPKDGGHGAVRDIIEYILRSQGVYEKTIEGFISA